MAKKNPFRYIDARVIGYLIGSMIVMGVFAYANYKFIQSATGCPPCNCSG